MLGEIVNGYHVRYSLEPAFDASKGWTKYEILIDDKVIFIGLMSDKSMIEEVYQMALQRIREWVPKQNEN